MQRDFLLGRAEPLHQRLGACHAGKIQIASAACRHALVRSADVTIALVGEHPSRSGEDSSLTNLDLPAGQLEVLREMSGIGKPLVAD